jgi:hypothetical protein
MKRIILVVVVLLSGCVVAPYNGYDAGYASPYAEYPSYGVYSAPVYTGPSVYFGGVYGHGYRGGHHGWHGRHR